MSNTIRKAREIKRTPRVRGNVKESFKAKEEFRLLDYKPSNRLKVRSNLVTGWTDRPCSGYREIPSREEILLPTH